MLATIAIQVLWRFELTLSLFHVLWDSNFDGKRCNLYSYKIMPNNEVKPRWHTSTPKNKENLTTYSCISMNIVANRRGAVCIHARIVHQKKQSRMQMQCRQENVRKCALTKCICAYTIAKCFHLNREIVDLEYTHFIVSFFCVCMPWEDCYQ